MQSGSKLPHSKVASHRPPKEAFAENGMTLGGAQIRVNVCVSYPSTPPSSEGLSASSDPAGKETRV